MKKSIAAFGFALGVLAAGCNHQQSQASSGGGAAVYPTGIVTPLDWASGVRAGIYASDDAKTCCFLTGNARLTLDNPAGSQLAVLTFYVPAVSPLQRGETVRAQFGNHAPGVSALIAPGMHDLTLTIPSPLRPRKHLPISLRMSVTWVPKKIGLNDDTRVLSIMLVRVGYI